jgi:hypothetical protein
MTLPKSWNDIKSRRLVHQVIEWDGEKTSEAIKLPVVFRPLHVAIDNADLDVNLSLTLEHFLRVDDTNASAQIGEGATGTVTVTADEKGIEGNDYALAVALAAENGKAMSVAMADKVITVTLGTTADGTKAAATIGSGANSTVTITVDAAGVDGNAYTVEVKVAETASTPASATLTDKALVVTLGTGDEGGVPDNTQNTAAIIAGAINQITGLTAEALGTGLDPLTEAEAEKSFADGGQPLADDSKNTAALIEAAINHAETGIKGFTAAKSGNGDGAISTATAEPIQFTGGTTDIYASLYDTDGNELSLTVNDDTRKVFGPFMYFPRYLGGRLVLTTATSGTAPADKSITIVQVVEG